MKPVMFLCLLALAACTGEAWGLAHSAGGTPKGGAQFNWDTFTRRISVRLQDGERY